MRAELETVLDDGKFRTSQAGPGAAKMVPEESDLGLNMEMEF